jgi:hypothetical protein
MINLVYLSAYAISQSSFFSVCFGTQDLILELYPKDSLVGWKIGATNQKALTALGLSEPLRGPLISNYVHQDAADLPVLQWSEMGCSLLAAEVKLHSIQIGQFAHKYTLHVHNGHRGKFTLVQVDAKQSDLL